MAVIHLFCWLATSAPWVFFHVMLLSEQVRQYEYINILFDYDDYDQIREKCTLSLPRRCCALGLNPTLTHKIQSTSWWSAALSVIQTLPKPVPLPSSNGGANVAAHYCPLITIYFLPANVKLWLLCGASPGKTGEIFPSKKNSKFKALRQKQVVHIQEERKKIQYIWDIESKGGRDGKWGCEK